MFRLTLILRMTTNRLLMDEVICSDKCLPAWKQLEYFGNKLHEWVRGGWRRDKAFSNFLFWIIVERSGMGVQQLAWGCLLPCCASLDTWHYCSRDESINVPTLHITQLKPLWHTPRSGFIKFSDGKHVTMQAWCSGYCRAFSSSCSDRKRVACFQHWPVNPVCDDPSSSPIVWFFGLKDKVKISNSIRFKVSMSLYFKGTVPYNRVYY